MEFLGNAGIGLLLLSIPFIGGTFGYFQLLNTPLPRKSSVSDVVIPPSSESGDRRL
jgi:hypothetical protein